MEAIKSEILKIKEAVRILKPLKSLDQHDLLKNLDNRIAAYEEYPRLESAKVVEEFKYQHKVEGGKRVFDTIFTYQINVFGDKTNLDRLLIKLRNTLI